MQDEVFPAYQLTERLAGPAWGVGPDPEQVLTFIIVVKRWTGNRLTV